MTSNDSRLHAPADAQMTDDEQMIQSLAMGARSIEGDVEASG